jgi:hypothetical protein
VLAHLLYAFGVFAVRHSCANCATGDTNHLRSLYMHQCNHPS